jgi:tetratricopeptide (TPR) repeat protein
LQWTINQGEGELGLRFIVSLWDYWKCANNLQEGRQFTLSVLEQTSGLQSGLRAQVLRMAGWLAHELRDTTTMNWAFQAARDLSGVLGDACGVGLSLHGLSELARLNGQFDSAKGLIEQSRKFCGEEENHKYFAWSQDLLGCIDLSQGDLVGAQSCFQKSLDVFRQLNHLSGLILSLLHLGQSLFYQGSIQQSALYFDECIALNEAVNRGVGSSYALALNFQAEIAATKSQMELAFALNAQARNLSKVAGYSWCVEISSFTAGLFSLRYGEFEEAANFFRESLLLQQSLKEAWRSLTLLEAAAELSVARMDGLAAARLFGAAQSLRKAKSIPQMDLYRASAGTNLATLKQQIDVPALEEAWRAGQVLSMEQAVAYAIRCLE